MKKPIDIALSSKIKQTLENYQPGYKPEYWEQFLQQKLQQNKRLFLWWPIIAKAAVVAILVSALPSSIQNSLSPKIWLPQNNFAELALQQDNYTEINISKSQNTHFSKQTRQMNERPEEILITNLPFREIDLNHRQKPGFDYLNTQYATMDMLQEALYEMPLEKAVDETPDKNMLLSFDISSAMGNQQQTNASLLESTVAAAIPLGKKWHISTGLRWQKNSEIMNMKMMLSPAADASMSVNEETNYQVLSVPLSFHFKINKNIHVAMGSSLDYVNNLHQSKTASMPSVTFFSGANSLNDLKHTSLVSNSYESTTQIDRLQLFSHLRLGISYQWQNAKRAMQFEPFMQFPVNQYQQLNNMPMLGVNLKYQWKFS